MSVAATARLTSAQLETLWQKAGVVDATAETVGLTLLPTDVDPWDQGEVLPRLLGDGTDFELVEPIAEGGMAVVHRGTQRSLGRDVAIKMLRSDRRSERMRSQLLREARIAGDLEHPNVIPVHAIGVDAAGEPALVMKHVEGVSWRDYLVAPDGRVPGDTAFEQQLEILQLVARAVHFAHLRGVVHRDIKPENVMIGRFGEVYLLDWGIALHLDRGSAHPRGVAGTPGYMAPEMASSGPVTPRTDVYLLGAVLHEILTGQPPHDGRSLYSAMMMAYRSEGPDYAHEVPPELAAVAYRAMSREPADRFSSADIFREAVRAYLRHRESYAVAHEAEHRLEAMLGADSAAEEYRHFGAARFGFEQALRIWPENGRARAGLWRALGEMALREARDGRVDAAESLLAELPSPDVTWVDAVAEARSRAAAADREIEALRALERDLDSDVGARARFQVTARLGVVLGVAAVVCGWLARRYLPNGPQPEHYLPHAAGLCVVGAAALLMQHRSLFQNRFNRRISTLAMLAFIAGLYFRILVTVLGLPFLSYLPLEWVLYGAILSCIGFFDRRRLAWSGAPLAVGALAMALWPSWIYELAGASVFLALGTLAVLWRPVRSASLQEPR